MRGPELPTADLYARLELPPDAAPEAIEIAWRTLLKVHHPDVAGEASLEIAKRINIAHDWLGDPDLRARYDRSRSARRSTRPMPPSRSAPSAPRWTRAAERHDHVHEARPPDVGLDSDVVLAFLDRVAALSPDEIDRLGLAAPPPLAFVASIRRFLGRERLTALDGLEALVAHRLPAGARAVPAAHDAVTSYGQYLVLEGFLGDLLSEPFLERVEERMTRGWLAAVGRTRYGPRTADVGALVARAGSLTAQEGSALVTAAAALGLTDRLWPHGTDPDEDEVLRVSATLAARDAEAA
ncbi:MAG: J domain-containing protein, partial [Chloroflexota bacterium]|nr:J domain-containing protein [Chloroflexota bacterium]